MSQTTQPAISRGAGGRGRETRGGLTEPRAGIASILVLCVLAVYFLIPIVWLLFATTKNTGDLTNSFGFWFAQWNVGTNLHDLFTHENGQFWRWLLNSAIYSGLGGAGSTLLATMAGYALAKYQFRGRELVFGLILSGVLVPSAVLALPLFLLLSQAHLVNTYWGVLLPSMISPFGVFLARVYATSSVPNELLEAARVDGAGELRTFFTISLRIMTPAVITIFLFQFVAIWNNFFLPLVVLSKAELYPVTLGLYTWQGQSLTVPDIARLVVSGSFISCIPLVIIFFFSQRYWRSGLTAGAVKA